MSKDNKKEKVEVKKKYKVRKSDEENKKTFDNVVFIVSCVLAILLICGIGATIAGAIKKKNEVIKNPIATIEIENYGTMTAELYPDQAPNTVANFIKLANNGFYNGLTFHRTIPNFMIQGGDPKGTGAGNATLDKLGYTSTEDYSIPGEFILNGFKKNTVKHTEGTLSMARADYAQMGQSLAKKGYNSASAQFFIMTADNTQLDGQYAAFGRLITGLDIAKKISNVEVETRDSKDTKKTADKPVTPVKIKTIRVETFGSDYGMPNTLKPFDYYSYMMSQYGSQIKNSAQQH